MGSAPGSCPFDSVRSTSSSEPTTREPSAKTRSSSALLRARPDSFPAPAGTARERAQKQAVLSAPVNRVKAATCRRLGAREILCGEFPVEQFVDYRCDVIRTLILIIEIIGMLPDVDRQQRSEALGQRQFGVGCLDDLERMPVGDEPSPTAAELLYGRVGELLLECVVAAERSIDLLGQRRAGLTATLWLQNANKSRDSRPAPRR